MSRNNRLNIQERDNKKNNIMQINQLISIIVPVYNVEKYISKCIDSVIAQTYKDYELILVDDGSTDNSGKICDEYALKDSRIKVIHKKNEGVTATRDRGVKEAKGEFLFFIDGDDYITENALELFTNKQKENDADLVKGSFCKISEENIILNKYIVPDSVKTVNEWFKYITDNTVWSIWNTLIRKNLYCKYVNVPNEISLGEDLITSSQLAIGLNKISTCQNITYYYVQRDTSIMHSVNKNTNREYNLYLLMIKELDHINTIYKTKIFKSLSKIIELLICDQIFIKIMGNNNLLSKHKKKVFKLYIKYFVINYNVQLSILKRSWKCYLYNWWCITKFIV